MFRSNPVLWPKPPAIWGYGIAVVSVGAVLTLSQLPAVHLQDAPVSLFLCAVILTAWFGGIGPGLLATVLSAVAFNYYFLPPIHSLTLKTAEIPRLVIFTVSALFVGALSAAERNATESLVRARDDLKVTVEQLRHSNEALQAESRERKSAEQSLRRSEGYLAEAQRLTHTGSWVWDVAGRRSVYGSQENYRLFGFDPEGGIPSDEAFYQRIHPEDRDRVRREVFLEKPEEGSHFDVDFRIVLPDRTMKYVRSTGHPVHNMSSDVLEYVGTSIDVTERKRAEEERERLRQAQEELAHVNRVTTMGELTASLAHEVNQPITAAATDANACLRWLTRDDPDLEEARAAASRIVKDAMRAADIIGRIRLFFTKSPPQRELVDINEVIREMVVLLRGEATRYAISVQTELAEDLRQVVGDRVQLQQVMMNLM